jgi:2-desacetyl-2-hydroxyethyl bacteriochlorophyllide A dehydrogenase
VSARAGRAGGVLGHELGVEVVEAPPDGGLLPGDRCAVEPYLSCGRCPACRLGKTNCCENLQVLGVHADGGMCGLLALPAEKLYKSDRLSLDQLALVETLGIGAHAVGRSGLQAGEDVLVIGAGPIGLAVTQFAREAGGRVKVVDVSPARRGFAERFGVEALPAADGLRAAVVFDATGNAAAMQASFPLVEFGGRLVLVGIVQDRVSFDDVLFHRREMTLLASRNSRGQFPRIIRLIETGRIDTTPWVTHRMGLADVPAAFAGLRGRPDLVKAMVEVGDGDV